MNLFLTLTVTGIASSAIIAIAACGLVVTYTTSGIFNFAHGAFGMMAAFTFWQLNTPEAQGGWGLGVIPSLIIVIGVIAPLFGWLVEVLIMRRLPNTSEAVRVVVTVALLLFLFGLANVVWPQNRSRTIPKFFAGEKQAILGVNVEYNRFIILATAAAVAGALALFLYRTRAGVAMRAVVDDRALLMLNGGRPDRSAAMAWAIGASLAAVAGIFTAMEFDLSIFTLSLLIVKAFAAAVIGKLRSLPMAFVGALIVGLGETYLGQYVSDLDVWGFDLSNVKFAVSPILLFIVMMAQPQERLRVGSAVRRGPIMAPPTLRTALIGSAVFLAAVWGLTGLVSSDIELIPVVAGFFFAIVALSLVPLTGYAGQISLAQLAFAGIGAVTMGKVGVDSTAAGVIVAVAISALVGALVALPALRLSGIYLALATTAFVGLMTQLVFNQQKLLPGGSISVPRLDLGFFAIDSTRKHIMVLGVAFCGVAVLVVWLRGGPYGRRLTALKDSPVACATLGLNLTRTKISVFALSAGIAGLAGSLIGKTVTFSDFELTQSMSVTTLAVVGGIGAIGGAFFGGFLLGSFQTLIAGVFVANAVGLFNYFAMSIKDFLQIMPGLMGINISQNPEGAAPQVYEAYGPATKSREALAIVLGGPTLAWVLARSDTISNWTFTALLVVMVFGVIPLVPVLLAPIPGGRALPAGVFLIVVLVGVGSLSWETLIGSNGLRVVVALAVAIGAAVVAGAIHGEMPRRGPEPEPSPDLIGIDAPISRSDVIEAERALGVSEADFRGAA